MAATMTTTPCSGNNATPLGKDATLLSACSATMMSRLGDDANLGDNATLLAARLVMTTPSLEALGDNTKLGNDSTLVTTTPHLGTTPRLSATTPSLSCKPSEATLSNETMPGDNTAKLGDDTTPLLMTTAMTATTMAAVAAAAAAARTTTTAAVTYRQQSTKRD